MLQVTFSWIALIYVPAYLFLLGVSWPVFHSMFVKVLLPENNPPPAVGLLMQTAASSQSLRNEGCQKELYVCKLQFRFISFGLGVLLAAYKNFCDFERSL